MEFSKYFLNAENFHYTRMNLFTWETGKNPSSLSESNADFLCSHLEPLLEQVYKKHIVINVNNINDIDDHFFTPLITLAIKMKISFIFFSNDGLHKACTYLDSYFKANELKHAFSKQNGLATFYISPREDLNSEFLKQLSLESESLEKAKLIETVSSSFEEKEVFLSSTPLRANGKFNANKLMHDPSIFRWLVSLFSQEIVRISKKEGYGSISIVASSLRGAILAGAVKDVLDYSLMINSFAIFDHIGPNMDFIKCPTEYVLDRKSKIIHIGDFNIAGTELKITKAFCNILGCNIEYSFVIGKFTKSDKVLNIKLHSLVDLKECRSNLKYELV